MSLDPILRAKRTVAVYLPYRQGAATYEFYLQKRDRKAVVHAGFWSLFGGGIEQNETPLQALRREIEEEMGRIPSRPHYLAQCETGLGVFFLFIEEVGDAFESSVTIREGEGGAFVNSDQALNGENVSPIARVAVEAVLKYLEKIR